MSGGDLARRCYERLADDAGNQIDWWKVDVYWGDERCLPLDHGDSNYRLARESLLERVGAVNANFPMRCEEGPDPYQLRLGELGRIDLVHLGMGPDGHTASLFPARPPCRGPREAGGHERGPLGRNPFTRMTLTLPGIAEAVGAGDRGRRGQADALARVMAGDAEVPASTSAPTGWDRRPGCGRRPGLSSGQPVTVVRGALCRSGWPGPGGPRSSRRRWGSGAASAAA